MNRFSLSAALLALTMIFVFLAWRVDVLEFRKENEISDSVVVDEFKERTEVRDSPTEDGESKVVEFSEDSFSPHGRFSAYEVLDLRVGRIGSADYRVHYMLRGEDPRIPLVFLEERYVLADDVAERIPSFQSAAKGNEIMFDADAAKVDPLVFAALLEKNDWTISWKSRLSGYVQVRLRNPTIVSIEDAVGQLSRAFPNTIVTPDHLHFSTAIPREYSSSNLWHLEQVNAPDAWEFNTGSDTLVVAVIDTGCFTDHVDLRGRIFVNEGEIAGNGVDDDGNGFVDDVSGWDFYDDDAIPNDETGHGTHVSGIVGAQGDNGIGIVGMNWNSRILPLKVGDVSGLSSSAIAEALRYVSMMKDRDVPIVASNNSYGSSAENPAALAVIREHEDKGILFVTAAGNSGEDLDSPNGSQFPAGFPQTNIISVANSTQGDALSGGSNYGLESVDIAAPGQEVYSTYNDGDYRFSTGTSMSSPMVAGAVALVASHNPDLSPDELKQRILDTAKRFDSLDGKLVSGGRLDLLTALEPGLVGHEVSVPSHRAHLTILPDIGIPVVFEIEALEDAVVSIETLSGGSHALVEEVSPRSYALSFATEGLYRFRVLSEMESIVRSVEKVVAVGVFPDVSNGLLHSWEMEGSDGVLIDGAGSGNGEFNGAMRVNAPLGRGVDFDGTRSSVKFNSSFSNQVTFSAFVKSDNLLSSPHPRIIDAPDYYLYFSTRGIVDIPDGNANALKFYSNRSEDFGVWHTPPDTVFQGEWLHVVASYDSRDVSNAPRLYINGKKLAVRTQRLPVGQQTTGGGEAFLGDRADGTRAWDGQMDEVRIYNRVVSDDEVVLLSARYLESVWSDYEIQADVVDGGNQSYDLSLTDAFGADPDVSYSWSVISRSGTVVLNGADEANPTVTFVEAENARILLKASGSAVTRYYRYDLMLDPIEIEEGVLVGETENSGVVWIEVDETLDRGYVTVLDATSGFERLREPIAIDFFGRFGTSESLLQRITGEIKNGFTGNIDGADIGISAGQTQTQSTTTGFEGNYQGGLIGEGSELLELRVLKNGALFVWLNGRDMDLALGVVDALGQFDVTTTLGNRFKGEVDLEKRLVTGSWTSVGVETVAYLREVQTEGVNRYVNLSTRGRSESGEGVLIGGFVVTGTSQRTVLLRGLGPALTGRDVSNVMEDPVITLNQGADVLARNEHWEAASNVSDIVAFTEKVGAAALEAGSLDAAMLVSLDPGLYTVLVGSDVGDGEALFEIFDDGSNSERALVNVSSRGMVRGEGQALIGGLVVAGPDPKLVLIRGVGPGLGDKGIAEPLANPMIELFLGADPIAFNDDWMDGSLPIVEGASLQGPAKTLKAAFESAGAFAFESESNDAAMLVWLEPGLYTVILRGVDGAEGIALFEAYEIE
ncbi:MAG: S8 family serine peptidase [Opitutales bacterium]|nr:S8 family serine peptidase [Opitutales bacterium]